MYPVFPITGTSAQSDEIAVDGTSRTFSNLTMTMGHSYLFVCTVDCWIKQGATPTASAAPGSMFLPSKTPIMLNGSNGAALAAIQDASAGKASLTVVQL